MFRSQQVQALIARRLLDAVGMNQTGNLTVLNYSYVNVSFCADFILQSGLNESNILKRTNLTALNQEQLACFSELGLPASPIPGFYDPAFIFYTLLLMMVVSQSIFIVKQMRSRAFQRTMKALMDIFIFDQVHRLSTIKASMEKHEKASLDSNNNTKNAIENISATTNLMQTFEWGQMKTSTQGNGEEQEKFSIRQFINLSHNDLFVAICNNVIDESTGSYFTIQNHETVREFLQRVMASLRHPDTLSTMFINYLKLYEKSKYSETSLTPSEIEDFRLNYETLLATVKAFGRRNSMG